MTRDQFFLPKKRKSSFSVIACKRCHEDKKKCIQENGETCIRCLEKGFTCISREQLRRGRKKAKMNSDDETSSDEALSNNAQQDTPHLSGDPTSSQFNSSLSGYFTGKFANQEGNVSLSGHNLPHEYNFLFDHQNSKKGEFPLGRFNSQDLDKYTNLQKIDININDVNSGKIWNKKSPLLNLSFPEGDSIINNSECSPLESDNWQLPNQPWVNPPPIVPYSVPNNMAGPQFGLGLNMSVGLSPIGNDSRFFTTKPWSTTNSKNSHQKIDETSFFNNIPNIEIMKENNNPKEAKEGIQEPTHSILENKSFLPTSNIGNVLNHLKNFEFNQDINYSKYENTFQPKSKQIEVTKNSLLGVYPTQNETSPLSNDSVISIHKKSDLSKKDITQKDKTRNSKLPSQSSRSSQSIQHNNQYSKSSQSNQHVHTNQFSQISNPSISNEFGIRDHSVEPFFNNSINSSMIEKFGTSQDSTLNLLFQNNSTQRMQNMIGNNFYHAMSPQLEQFLGNVIQRIDPEKINSQRIIFLKEKIEEIQYRMQFEQQLVNSLVDELILLLQYTKLENQQ